MNKASLAQFSPSRTRTLLSNRWWLHGIEDDLARRALMFGVSKSWQKRVNQRLDANKSDGKFPKSQESLSSLLGIDKTNLFVRGGHSTSLMSFFLMAQHLDVAIRDLLPDEVEILTQASSMVLRSDTPAMPLDPERFTDCFLYAVFQVHRNRFEVEADPFGSASVKAMNDFVDRNPAVFIRLGIVMKDIATDRCEIARRVTRTADRIVRILERNPATVIPK
jgi:glutamine amidotransferase PdxT